MNGSELTEHSIFLNALGLHGTKRRWSSDVVMKGLTRPDSACFFWLPEGTGQGDAAHETRWQHSFYITLTLCMYFALSLSTLHYVQATDWDSWYECMVAHPEWLPEIVVLRLPAKPACKQSYSAKKQRYYSFLPVARGWSLPYAKVAQCPALMLAEPLAAPLTITLETIRAAEQEARSILQTWPDSVVEAKSCPRFFCKGAKLTEEYADGVSFWGGDRQSAPPTTKLRKLQGLTDPRLVALFCNRLACSYAELLKSMPWLMYDTPRGATL